MATGGLALLLISIVSAVLLITDFVLGRRLALVLTAITAAWFLAFWLALPLAGRRWSEPDIDDEDDDPRALPGD